MNNKGWQPKVGFIFIFSAFINMASCSNVSLKEYNPKNQEEQNIVLLLVQYQEAKINCDLDQYLACLHEKGQYHFARGSMVSKEELRKHLPVFWSGLQSGNRVFYPMNREMITGNYIRTGRFINQKYSSIRILLRLRSPSLNLGGD